MFLFLVTPYFVLAVQPCMEWIPKKTFCDTGPKKSFQFESDKDVIEDDADDDMSDTDDDMSANDNLNDAN